MNCIVQNEDMQVTPEHETMSEAMSVSKVEPLESCSSLGTEETHEEVSGTLGPRILETYSSHAYSMINSEETASSAKKSFKQLSAEGFFRCGNRDRSCSYLTQLPTQFDAHMRKKHASEEAFPCVHCGSMETTSDSLLQHLEEHLTLHQSLLLYCAEATCNFNSSSPEDVLQHIVNSHSTLTSFKCWCCPAIFSSIQTFVTHVKQNMFQVAKCPHCSAKDTDSQRILTHISNSHPGCGRMVKILKLFLCADRTMSAWQGQNAKHAEQQNLKQETIVIDVSDEDEMIIHFDNTATNPSVGNDIDGCANHDVVTVQRTADKLKLRDNARCRVTVGEKSQNKVCEKRVIDSSCRQSTAAMAESSATSVDRNEHDDAGETEMEISHNEEVGRDCVLASTVQKSGATVKRNYHRTRKSGSNARPQTRTVQEPNVSSKSSNRPIPSTDKIVTKDCFSSETSGDKTTYFCKFCTYKFNKEAKSYGCINSRKWQHIKNKHKQKPDTRNEPWK